ncbi:MAG: hypothetical protein AB8B52_02720 [Winogradskyella sp.]|uniref:hypothetical protein n=1 Tax=Winogradskyella sp. TaxID=1883156 RepID=UPI00385D8AD1
MKIKTKASVYIFLIFLVTYLVLRFGIQLIFPEINTYVLTAIAASITIIASPKRRIVRKPSGNEIHLKWFFSERIIVLK